VCRQGLSTSFEVIDSMNKVCFDICILANPMINIAELAFLKFSAVLDALSKGTVVIGLYPL